MSNQKPKGVGDIKVTLKDLDDFFNSTRTKASVDSIKMSYKPTFKVKIIEEIPNYAPTWEDIEKDNVTNHYTLEEDVNELTDKPYTDAELRHFEEVAGVEKGSFENYKLSMQDEEAYTVYNARDKSLQAIHDYLCMLDPRNVDSIANFVDQIQIVIYNTTDFDLEEYFADGDYYLDSMKTEDGWDDEDDE